MDRRESAPHETAYQQDLKKGEIPVDDKVVENGKTFRIPFKMVKQVAFSNVRKDELIDLEHAARLQYRLLLLDSVIKAKVEFAKLRIHIIFNPPEAQNRKEKISVEGLMDFLAGEGVHVEMRDAVVSDYDYYKEMYVYQFDPPSIREHAPYSYSMEEWKKMKANWLKNTAEYEKMKVEKFHAWQKEYAQGRPEIPGTEGAKVEKKGLRARLFGKKKEKSEKGFWFHGV
jgi:hypothetical protein